MNWPDDYINKVVCGDCLEVMKGIPDGVVQCCITSPPYWGLRDYGTATWEGGDAECDHLNHRTAPQGTADCHSPDQQSRQGMLKPYGDTCGRCGAVRVDDQLGLESTIDEYVAKMVEVFAEVRRVLRDDATLWLNLGDSYSGSWGAMSHDIEGKARRTGTNERPPQSFGNGGLKPKDLCMIPARVALALQADGWYLRSDIIWSKPNPMPESVTDRPTKSHEYLFLLSKSERYYYDADAIREPYEPSSVERRKYPDRDTDNRLQQHQPVNREYVTPAHTYDCNPRGRNKRTVWTIATEPTPYAHFATFPEKLVEPCILAGTSEKGQCPECGTPWTRMTTRTRTFESGSGRSGNMPVGENGPDMQGGGETGDVRRGPTVHVSTLGWRPDCLCGSICPADPVPQIILDPFAGKGTTAKRAKELGRQYVTCDLNEEYCALARQELAQGELF